MGRSCARVLLLLLLCQGLHPQLLRLRLQGGHVGNAASSSRQPGSPQQQHGVV